MKKDSSKQMLFEMMHKVGGMPLNENWLDNIVKDVDSGNIDKNKINNFVSKLPNNFPDLVRNYAKNKDIGLDSAYYQFLGTFMEKNGIDLNDDELEELETYMYGKYGDDKIEF